MKKLSAKEFFRVGDKVKDNTFNGRIGIVTAVTNTSIRVKYESSKVHYTELKLPDFADDITILYQ